VAELAKLGSRFGIAEKKVETLKAELESLRSLAKGVVSKAKEELEDISDEAKSGVKTSADDLKSKVDKVTRSVEGFKTQVEDTYRTTFETGETIGKYETLKPLVNFISTGQGKAGEVIPLAAKFMGKLVPWASDNQEYGIWDRAKALNDKLNEILDEG
jgi:gas vesicle protein